jgi:hypothetical protein
MGEKGLRNTKPASTWKAAGGGKKGAIDGALGPT